MLDAATKETPVSSADYAFDDAKKFQAVLTRFQDHTETLRALTGFDLQIFGGYITLQLAIGAWLAEHPATDWGRAIGLVVLDLVLSGLAGKLLFNNFKRRQEI